MILYGSKAVHLLTGAGSPDTACPVCGTEGEMEYQVFRRHAHIYWLPLFPMNRVGLAQCNHCFKAFEKKEMSEDMLLDYNELKQEAKGKWWQWIGLILILSGFVFGYIASFLEEGNLKEHLQSPQVGDVYKYEIEDKEHGTCYSLLKVLAVTGDSITVAENMYQCNLKSGLEELDVDSNYYTNDYTRIHKNAIQELYDEGVVFELK